MGVSGFRESLRVSPYTFDKICTELASDPVFTNKSQNEQIPLTDQLADWAGLGKGTVHLITRRVMTAVLRPSFRKSAVSIPYCRLKKNLQSPGLKLTSCRAWRNGWCLVDGTLIPLYDRPHWYGESYFDRKSNYSLNVQVF
ncbi:hypothetical protein DEU56DRAFT_874369 [Suillus clintonianus]|uniref:uncharacterized protein n=1 Tax=Suillus clintonianus TaxID=1904413 RepID=UPI001B87EE89|nr:uncharacterized protein DEU56DRAFT_874369 [Suillus clintonianus]KAG2112519.1 hypothetical protein DEU56DRAFT_874369 [Suillus clintonianus]